MNRPEPTEKMIEAACRAYAYRLEQQRNEIHKASGRPNLARSEENMAAAVDRSWRLHRSGMEAALTAALAVEAGTEIDGGRFENWSTSAIAAECRAQSRDQLDPEFSRFMGEVAKRLSALTTSPASSGVEGEAVAYFTPYYENDRTGKLVPVIVSAESVTEPRGDWTPLYRLPASPAPQTEERADG